MLDRDRLQNLLADATYRQGLLEDLMKIMCYPTVSADPYYAQHVRDCAAYLADFGKHQLAMKTEVVKTAGHPCVIMHSAPVPGAKSVLIYGHYDVQPAEDVELWKVPPFEPYALDNVLHGRGACDDKGQFSIWLSALKSLRTLEGGYPLNVTVLLEGEEEISSPNLKQVLLDKVEELRSDYIIVSDTSSAVKLVPTMHYSLRGVVGFEVHLRTAVQDLHSGVHGGVSPNAVIELTKIISQLHDKDCKVTVPGFYEGVRPMEDWEAELLSKVPFNEKEYAEGFKTTMRGEVGFTTNERRWFRPTLDCNGIYGGYTGIGAKTIVPAVASAKFSARIVVDQDPQRVMDLLKKWFEDHTPEWCQLEFVPGDFSRPYLLDRDLVRVGLFKSIQEAMRHNFGCEPLICRNGGAIGVVEDLNNILQAPVLLLGFGSPDDNLHGPNEKFELANFFRGIAMGAELLHALA